MIIDERNGITTHKFDGGIILYTSQVCPPYDNTYQCIDDNYDGAPDADYHVVGEGINDQAAIVDWYEKTQEHKEMNP